MISSSKSVLVIIVNFNSAAYIGDCLRSLQQCKYSASWKILLIDNASTDNSVALARSQEPALEIIHLENNLGFAEGNNVGIRYAFANGYDYVYLLNQDTEVAPDFLDHAVRLAETDQTIGAVQSKLLLHNNRQSLNSKGNAIHYLGYGFAAGHQTPDSSALTVCDIAYPSGAGVLLRCSLLQIVGLLRSSFFMYHEDLELGWRIRLAGYRNVFCPQSVVYHKYEFSRSIKKFYFMERNRFITLLTCYRWSTLMMILPMLLFMEVGTFIFSIKNGWWREKLRAWLFILSPLHWPDLHKQRREIQVLRKVSDRKIISLFTNTIDFQEVQSPIMRWVVNPILLAYGRIIAWLVAW